MNQAERSSATGGGVRPLGHEVFEVDTRMAGHDKITAGYLIRAERPCLVETGTAPSAPVVAGALAALGIGPADLGLPELDARLAEGEVREVILATNSTVEGEATAYYIAELAQARGSVF